MLANLGYGHNIIPRTLWTGQWHQVREPLNPAPRGRQSRKGSERFERIFLVGRKGKSEDADSEKERGTGTDSRDSRLKQDRLFG